MDDLISRKQALKGLIYSEGEGIRTDGVLYVPLKEVYKYLRNLPSVESNLKARKLNNSEKFKDVFGLYATELWAMPHEDFLRWINAEYKETELEQSKIIRCKDCEFWEKQKDSLQGRCELMQMYPTGGWYCGNAQKRVVKQDE